MLVPEISRTQGGVPRTPKNSRTLPATPQDIPQNFLSERSFGRGFYGGEGLREVKMGKLQWIRGLTFRWISLLIDTLYRGMTAMGYKTDHMGMNEQFRSYFYVYFGAVCPCARAG